MKKQGVHELLQFCPRLTHLSLTGVQAFLREDLTRFCREAPPEFTHLQRDLFCVFSGDGVSRLREYLKRLAEDQEREGRISRDEPGTYSEAEADSSRETISDDGTIDAAEDVAERQPPVRPRLVGHRSYAEVVSGSGSNSPEREYAREDDDEGLPQSQAEDDRLNALFQRRSSRAGPVTEHSNAPRFRGYLYASRSVSVGQGSSSRPTVTHPEASAIDSRFPHAGVSAFDDYFSATAEPQHRRPLPPRPHWPPQPQAAQFFEGDQQISAPDWGDPSTGQASRDATTVTGSGSVPGRSGIQVSRADWTASHLYDTDDGEETVRQSYHRAHRETDGEMES